MSFRRQLERAEKKARTYSGFGFRGPLGGGLWGRGNAHQHNSVPALYISGQSNAGNVDLVAGTSDVRVTFTWTPDGAAFTGPGAMNFQNANAQNGHSYEWQCSSDMARAFNSNVLVGKAWADGATCDLFIRAAGAPAWKYNRNMIDNFARQCVVAGLTQVAFIWDQGSSEALVANAALTPQLTTNTTSLFASIRALFKAYGIGRVRFYVMQQNIHFLGLPNIDAGQLASVRAQEAAIVAGDPDAALINVDSIVMASGYHYANGQTNTIGSVFAARIATDFTATQPAFVTPPTVETVMASILLNHTFSTAGIGVATGQPIPTWADQSAHHSDATAAGSARPLYLANALGTTPGVQYDGVANQMQVANTLNQPAPSVTPTWSWEITRPDQWINGSRLWSSGTGVTSLLQFGGSPNFQIFNGAFGGVAASVLNSYNRFESYFANSAAAYQETATGVVSGDYCKVGEGAAAGANTGNGAVGTITLGTGSTVFGKFTNLDRIICSALPTKAMFDFLCGYYTSKYGITVNGIT
jgi:hypothetical protein